MQSIAAIAQALTQQGADSLSSTNLTSSLAGSGSAPSPFSGVLEGAISSMNKLDQQATAATQGLLMGNGVDVSQAMIATEKADTAFQFALAVHNKAIAAYQQVMNMQF